MQKQLTQEYLDLMDAIDDPVIFMDLLWYDRGYKMDDYQDARMILSEVYDEIVDTSCPETGKTFQLVTRAYYFCGKRSLERYHSLQHQGEFILILLLVLLKKGQRTIH